MTSHLPICRKYVYHVLESVPGRPRLQSASSGGVELPRVLRSTGPHSFSFHGPSVWNRLPSALRDGGLLLNTFAQQLKTIICLDSNCTPPCAVVTFCDFGVVYKFYDLITYLLND